MYDFVKICRVHGKLNINQVIKAGVKNNIQNYRCSECYKIIRKNNYHNNKEKISLKNKKWREKNKDKMIYFSKKYRDNKKLLIKQIEDYQYNQHKKFCYTRAYRRFVNLILDINKVERNANKKY